MDRAKILVVDDVAENIHTLKNLLKDDYTIIAATNGQKAIDIAQKDPKPDLIILDILMPQMDGFEVCRVLQDSLETKDIPIIFVTSLSDVEEQDRGVELGAVDYIHKPISPKLTKQRIATHLKLKECAKANRG
ncbi:MAG: response regulator [Campylobacterota bacterium]|nr:response regulator [Campylobacterota bacterium]